MGLNLKPPTLPDHPGSVDTSVPKTSPSLAWGFRGRHPPLSNAAGVSHQSPLPTGVFYTLERVCRWSRACEGVDALNNSSEHFGILSLDQKYPQMHNPCLICTVYHRSPPRDPPSSDSGPRWLRRQLAPEAPLPRLQGGCRALSPVPPRFRFRLCPWRRPLPLLSVTDIPLHSALELSIASVEDGSPCRPGPSPRSWWSHATMRCPCLPMRSQDRQRLSPESGHALGPHITHTDCRGLNDVPEDSETSDSRQ